VISWPTSLSATYPTRLSQSSKRRPPVPASREWSTCAVRSRLRPTAGLVHVCAVTLLEIGYSVRNAAHHARLLGSAPLSRMIVQWDTPAPVTRRAYEMQGLLAAGGRHRAPSVADLLLAGTAEAAGLTVLHCDRDFELIADMTGQALYRLS
jgi:predicted nucleic acid-binding protein